MTYQQTLSAYLATTGTAQAELAAAIGKTQGSVSRYANGRFPDADTARLIDKHTGGQVPFEVWQREYLSNAGIAA
jgi:transcriptional regulator with XRE-family HTH domain